MEQGGGAGKRGVNIRLESPNATSPTHRRYAPDACRAGCATRAPVGDESAIAPDVDPRPEEEILGHDGDLAPELGQAHLGDVHPAQQHPAILADPRGTQTSDDAIS